jgi:hypothetical protein
MMDKILEFLYYQVPQKYALMLGEDRDPNENEISLKIEQFEEHMILCSLKDYCQLLVKAFIVKYPSDFLYGRLVTFDMKFFKYLPGSPLRSKDIKQIDFNYKKARLYGRFDTKVLRTLEYLDEVKVTFKAAQSQLVSWVEGALIGKAFNKTTSGANTTFIVSNSPILKIEVNTTSFTIFIDKNSFIEYLFQSRGYEE